MSKKKPNTAKLASRFQQVSLSYRACMQAVKNSDYKEAVKLQLSSIEAFNAFNDQLLIELDNMRKEPRTVWIP